MLGSSITQSILLLFILFTYVSDVSSIGNLTTNTSTVPSDKCELPKNASQSEKCWYVQLNDACEGGGYLNWTSYVVCEQNSAAKVVVLVIAVIVMLYLFIMLSSAADDFFSPNVTGIVEHLGISESIAGVTFMAFGNGAPDIFGSVASVLSSSRPKAGLAIGELLGGGVFVTLVVTAAIIYTRPFEVSKVATGRDLIFTLVTLGGVLFVFLYDSQVHLWQPLCFLGIYIVYVCLVIGGHVFHQRRREVRRSARASALASARHSVSPPTPVLVRDAVSRILSEQPPPSSHPRLALPRLSLAGYLANKRASIIPEGFQMGDIGEESDSDSDDVIMSHHDIMAHGVHGTRSRAHSIAPPEPTRIDSARTFWMDIVSHLHPIDSEEWTTSGKFGKAFMALKAPFMVIFKATIPHCENSWSKPIAMLLALTMPQSFLFCIQEWTVQPIGGGPGLYAYAFLVSLVVAACLFFFTKQDDEPRYYKPFAMYSGFVMAIAWIYLIANEVVGTVTMLGVVSGIAHEVLGLTILAWCNSIGDMIADISVAKQGYPRMAIAASIGGPLFNLLIGFGLPFGIAKAKGTYVQMSFSPVNHLLVLFLGISLVVNLGAMFIQRWHVGRIHAYILLVIYAAFIVGVILAETHVFTWN